MSYLLLLLFVCVHSFPLNPTAATRHYCTPMWSCWPNKTEVAALADALNTSGVRVLMWPGGAAPRVCAVPVNSPSDQPLYGAGVNGMAPVYYNATESAEECFGTASYHPVNRFSRFQVL